MIKGYGMREIEEAKAYFLSLIRDEDITVRSNDNTYNHNLEVVLFSAEQLESYNPECRIKLRDRLRENDVKMSHIPNTVIPNSIEVLIEKDGDCKHEEECTLGCRTLRDMVSVLGSYLQILRLEERAKPKEEIPVRCC